MTVIDYPTFVLQRKIGQPLDALELVVREPRLLRAGAALADGETVLTFDRAFGVTLPPFGHSDTSWSAPVSARTPHGRAVQEFELELNRWDRSSTELLVRPRAARPDRWKSRRRHRYFRTAHAAADIMATFLERQALELSLLDAAPRGDDRSSRPSSETRQRASEARATLSCSSVS